MKPSELPGYWLLLAATVLALAAWFALGNPAHAHSWYDMQCCAANDCAPVIETRDHPEGWLMRTEHGITLVPVNMPKGEEWREKENKHDAKTHVCMRKPWISEANEPPPVGGMKFLCIYRPALN